MALTNLRATDTISLLQRALTVGVSLTDVRGSATSGVLPHPGFFHSAQPFDCLLNGVVSKSALLAWLFAGRSGINIRSFTEVSQLIGF